MTHRWIDTRPCYSFADAMKIQHVPAIGLLLLTLGLSAYADDPQMRIRFFSVPEATPVIEKIRPQLNSENVQIFRKGSVIAILATPQHARELETAIANATQSRPMELAPVEIGLTQGDWVSKAISSPVGQALAIVLLTPIIGVPVIAFAGEDKNTLHVNLDEPTVTKRLSAIEEIANGGCAYALLTIGGHFPYRGELVGYQGVRQALYDQGFDRF